ncbi:autotransporter outer membrane beta-barrel domain-containing protein [Rhizomicrobium electricum]|uniref:Autotransporter domain-containing protein n=1 Tax=Rhizomicrobium electricum TaxID=480070 RepID=A0ABN1F3S6_9PROT|nr:autotransporter outer membrane beta-barrel domain-containing protein [Rhizomicrobium electricum]NIJ49331.1 uncharacterized protein with beta-barrel porin domain [Rhizomicrobium electricum]
MNMNRNKFQTRLFLSASALVFAACMGAASATDVVLDTTNTPRSLMGDATVDNLIIGSGQTGYLTANYNTAPAGDLAITWTGSPSVSSTGACDFGGCFATADTITVRSGGKIIVDNPWGWQPFQSIFNVAGDAEFGIANWGGGTTILMGTSTFTGNLTLDAGVGTNTNLLQVGQDWKAATIVFGANSNIILNSGTHLEMWMPSSAPAVVGGTVSGPGALTIHSGSMTINGIATNATSYTGTVTLGAGAGLVIGDATHSGAKFGDIAGSTAVINVNQSGGTLATVKGYGTFYGTLNNNGVVAPGGTTGTLGTLTVTNYTQAATGVLQVEISPTGASKLNVTGTAALNGSMSVKIDAGDYGNSVFPILTAHSITGSFSTVSTTGSVSGAIVALQTSSTGYSIVTEKASSSQVIGHLVTANRNGIYAFTDSLYDVGPSAVHNNKVSFWLTPTGRLDNIGRDGAGYGLSAYGISGGAQYNAAWKNATVGFALGYDHASLDVKNEDTKAHSNTVNLALYGGADVLNARIDGAVFYNTYDAASKRVMEGYGTAAASPKGWGWGATVQVSRSLFHDRVVPYVRGTFARVIQDAVTESGVSTFDLAYKKIDANTFVGDLGFKVNVLPETSKIKLQTTVALRHDFSDPGETVNGSFAELSGSSFSYHWKGDAQNTLIVGANAGGDVLPNLSVFGRVQGEFTQARRAVAFGLGAKYKL